MSSIPLTYAEYAASTSWDHQAVTQRIDASQNRHELTSIDIVLPRDIRYKLHLIYPESGALADLLCTVSFADQPLRCLCLCVETPKLTRQLYGSR